MWKLEQNKSDWFFCSQTSLYINLRQIMAFQVLKNILGNWDVIAISNHANDIKIYTSSNEKECYKWVDNLLNLNKE